MYKAIIFDFFDVIYTDSFKAWLKKHNFKNKDELKEITQLACRGKIDSNDFFQKLSSASNISIKKIKSEFDRSAKLDTEIVELIKFLHKQYRLGIISNAFSGHLRSIIKKYELESLFDEMLISSEIGIVKPDPHIFYIMLDKLGVDPGDTIFIDDHKYNIDGAESLGIHGIWYKDFKTLTRELIDLGVINRFSI